MGYSVRPHILPHKHGVFRPRTKYPTYYKQKHKENMGYLVRPPVRPDRQKTNTVTLSLTIGGDLNHLWTLDSLFGVVKKLKI